MTTDNKQLGLESFFPSIEIDNLPTKHKKEITILIQRRSPYSDTWICNNCSWTGDRFFMEQHPCRQNIKNNFARTAKKLQQQELN